MNNKINNNFLQSILKKGFQNPALRISLGYLIIGLIYIYFSDKILFMLVKNPETLTTIQTFKGFGFVIASSILLYAISSYVIKQNIRLIKEIAINKDEYNKKLQQSIIELQNLHAELEKRIEERTYELMTSNKDLRALSSSLS